MRTFPELGRRVSEAGFRIGRVELLGSSQTDLAPCGMSGSGVGRMKIMHR